MLVEMPVCVYIYIDTHIYIIYISNVFTYLLIYLLIYLLKEPMHGKTVGATVGETIVTTVATSPQQVSLYRCVSCMDGCICEADNKRSRGIQRRGGEGN